jgi:branched-chain amino acid transport system substrate-binding protein
MVRLLSFIFSLLLFSINAFAQENSTFKVGVILPLTGAVAEYGVATKNGIELAKKEHPELFSKVQFIYDDSQYEGKKALSGFQKLKNSDGVSLVYIWGYGPVQAVAPVAETDRFPVIAVSAERSISLNRKYTLRFGYHIEMIANSLLDYFRAHSIKHVGIVKTELAYMNGLLDAIKKNLKSDETMDIVDTYQPSDTDFKTTITKLRTKKFDAVGVFLIGGQISQFYRQSKQLDLKLNTFGTDAFDSMKEAQDAQGAMTGAVFIAPYADSGFVQRYVKTFGNDLQAAWAANGYEYALLTAKLFGEKQEKLTADQILERYKSSDKEQGETATYKFNESPEGSGFDFKVVARKIEADKIVDITK